MALVDRPAPKDSISLFGQKKKSQAEKIVDELSNKNIPAKIIRLDNGTEKVINLVSGKAVYSGKIETKDNSVGSQVTDLLNNRRYPVSISNSGDPTYYDPNNPASEYMDVSPAVTDTFDGKGVTYSGPGGSYTFSETPTTDVYSEGYFPESDNLPSSSVVTTKQLFGDDTNYIPDTNYPRRDTIVENQLDEDSNFLQRAGDNIIKVFTNLKEPVQVSIDPVTGENVARAVPVLGAIFDTVAVATPFSGLGAAMGTVSDRLLARQESDARYAVEGFSGFAAIQAIDLGTGNPVTITASPGLGGTVSTNQNIVGPLAYNGSVFANATAVAAEAIKPTTPTVTGYADRLYRTSPRAEEGQEEIGRPRVQVNPLLNRGEYNDETGEVNLGAGRFGQTTGVFLTDDGTYQFTSGRASLVTDSKGNPVTTNNGIVYSGLRGNIVSSDTVPNSVNLLSGMEDGSIKTDDYTLTALTGTQDYIDQNTNFNYNYPTMNDYSTSSPLDLVETEFYNNDPVGNVTESGVSYGGPGGSYTFSETLDSDVYSEGTTPDFYDPPEEDTNYNPVTLTPTPAPDPFYNQSDDGNNNDTNTDTGLGGSGGQDFGYTAMGGRIGKQEGGIANQQGVSQIVQGAGFIAPQGNATDQQTIADDIPIEAEEGDFIINAPAAEFAGRQDIVTMITEAINSLREKGVDIQYGNPTIPVEKSVKLAVSRNEVYVPRVVAEEIGYDKLQKINKRGQKEVQRRQEEAQGQAARGGFVAKADGDVVTRDETLKEDKSSMIGTDEGSFIQDIGRAVYQSIKDNVAGFLSPKETEKQELKESDMPKSRPANLETSKVVPDKQKSFVSPMKKMGLQFPENSEKGRTFNLLTLLETLPNQDTRIGYIPKGNDHSSGTTVALGFDIGQHSAKDLLKYKFSGSLYNKLVPYTQKTLDVARQFTKQNPLNLSNEELEEINIKGVLDVGIREFERQFPEFKNVPVEDKAVLYSAYHLGGLRPDGVLNDKKIKRTPENPKAVRYGKFYKIYKDSGSIQNALQGGLLNIIKKGGGEWNRADKANTWVEKIQRKFMGTPKPRPSSIKSRPEGTSNPTSSFLNSPTMG